MIADRDGAPFAAGRTPAQRVTVNDGEHTAIPRTAEGTDRLTGQFLNGVTAGGGEDAAGPTGNQNGGVS